MRILHDCTRRTPLKTIEPALGRQLSRSFSLLQGFRFTGRLCVRRARSFCTVSLLPMFATGGLAYTASGYRGDSQASGVVSFAEFFGANGVFPAGRGMGAALNPVPGFAGENVDNTPIRFEVESPLEIVRDTGAKGEISTVDATLDSGESVTLYDSGDTVRVSFSVARTGVYRIAVRVRAGGAESPTSFWPDGYSFRLDGATLILVGDKKTLSPLDPALGGCHWGNMVSGAFPLRKGTHSLDISATADWAAVDYLELSPAERAGREVMAQDGRLGEAGFTERALVPDKKPEPIRIEAEAGYTVERDTGDNSPISVADGTLDSGESVKLYDPGDAVRLTFSVAIAADYRLLLRVRSGGETGRTVFWPDGYKCRLDDWNVELEGDENSVSERDDAYGGCYWGTLRSKPIALKAGSHFAVISAETEWAVLDYLELVPEQK
jgi:hypothetical protein